MYENYNIKCEYQGVIYKVLQQLESDECLLVVVQEEFDKGIFPIQSYIIPSKVEFI
jgi:hypothetical protein